MEQRKAIQLASLVLLFMIVRIFMGVWMWGVRQVLPGPITSTLSLAALKGVTPEVNPWLEPWQRWDTLDYQAIAARGYTAFDAALFTPPLFPLLMRFCANLTAGNTLTSGLLVSGLALLFSMLALHQLALFELGEPAGAMRAVVYLVSFPTAFFLSAAYSESLFLLGAILSLLAARKGQWIQAGIWGGLAGLSRTPGVFLALPLAYEAWSAWKKGDRHGWPAVALTVGLAALYPLYVWLGLHRSPLAIMDALHVRGGYLTVPGLNMIEAARRIMAGEVVAENVLELAFASGAVIAAIFVWQRLPRIYGIYTATLLLLFLGRMGSPQPLVSIARYVSELFPVFMMLAMAGSNARINRLIVYASWAGLLFASGQFAIGGWIG